MNCDIQYPRYLCFVDSANDNIVKALKSIGLFNLILRKHSQSVELDFRYKGDLGKAELKAIIGNNDFFRVEEDFSALSPSEILSKSTELIKGERYWECHNYLEELWKRNSGPKKTLIHDVIGIVVSQIKVQMGQREVGKVIYERSKEALKGGEACVLLPQLPSDFHYPLKISLNVLSPLLDN